MSFTDILSLLGPVVLMLGLLYGALWFVKKYSFGAKGRQLKTLNVNVLSNQMIVPKKYVTLLRVEDKILVLGVSENSISLLKEIEFSEEFNNESNQTYGENKFWNILKKKM